MKSTVVLLSGGIDSSVNLYQAHQETVVKLALTFDYGQRAHEKEVAAAQKMTARLGIPHQILRLPFFKNFGKSSLIDEQQEVPVDASVSIDDLPTSQRSAKAVWVPNRNGILLNIAAGFAESLEADWIVPGFNLEEATTFPDNSAAFIQTLNDSLKFSTSNQVQVKCWTTELRKPEIVALGERLSVVWDEIWPCYFSGEKWCGRCESCQRAHRAFDEQRIDVKRCFL